MRRVSSVFIVFFENCNEIWYQFIKVSISNNILPSRSDLSKKFLLQMIFIFVGSRYLNNL